MDKPRIVVFEVAAVIDLEGSVLHVQNPFITVAGQTAPDPGTTIIMGGISVTTHEVILHHIRKEIKALQIPFKSKIFTLSFPYIFNSVWNFIG